MTEAARNPVEELADDFLARYRRGERPALSEYAQKHPELAGEIRELFPALVMMEEAAPSEAERAAACTGRITADGQAPRRLGDYRILREVGRGGMGVVYEAEQEALGRRVALKVLPYAAAANATLLGRFDREARSAARLHHTNIVPVYDVGEHQGVHYYAMQFIHGQGLDRVLLELRRLRSAEKAPARERAAEPPDLSASLAESLLSGQLTAGEGAKDDTPPTSSDQPSDGSGLPAKPGGLAATAGSPASAVSSTVSDLSTPASGYHRSAARLALQAAEALGYAHGQKVLHRDIKPSNLLLDLQGTIWITDFGLAKEEGDDLTRTGDVVGTLRYLAPERFHGHADARSDLYSLGLTLYELFTLRPAFEEADRSRLVWRILHEEPPGPRQVDPTMPRDLETIVLKATAKDPAQRYRSVADLAEDLRRFLADRPILARRSAAWERAWRWARRNPAIAGLTLTLAAVVAVALAGATALWLRAEHLRRNAERDRQEALADFRLAREAVESYTSKVSENAKLKETDWRPFRKELLQTALPFYEKLIERHADKPEVQVERARAYFLLGALVAETADKREALPLFEKASRILEQAVSQASSANSEDLRELTKYLENLAVAYFDTGRTDEGLAELMKLLPLEARLAREHPEAPEFQDDLANTHNNLAVQCQERGRLQEAESHYVQAADIAESLAKRHPDNAKYQMHFCLIHASLGALHALRGRLPEAARVFQTSLRELEPIARRRPNDTSVQNELAYELNYLGRVQETCGHLSDAEARYRQAAEVLERSVRLHPSATEYQQDLARSLNSLAALHRDTGRLTLAESGFSRALQLGEGLIQRSPGHHVSRRNAIVSRRGLASVYEQTARLPQAEKELTKATAQLEQLTSQNPEIHMYQHDLAITHLDFGRHYRETSRDALAGEKYGTALSVLRALSRQYPNVPGYQASQAECHIELGDLCRQTDRFAMADAAFAEARAMVEVQIKEGPLVLGHGLHWGMLWSRMGALAYDQGELKTAVERLQQAIAELDTRLQQAPTAVSIQRELRAALCQRARALNCLERFAAALGDCERALQLGEPRTESLAVHALTLAHMGQKDRCLSEIQELGKIRTLAAVACYDLASASALLAGAFAKDGDISRARAQADQAMERLGDARAAGYFRRASHIALLKTDANLQSLRARPDFQEFQKALAGAAGGSPRN